MWSDSYASDRKLVAATTETTSSTDVQLCGQYVQIEKDELYELTFSVQLVEGSGYWPLSVQVGGVLG